MKSMGSPIHRDLSFWLHYLCVLLYVSIHRRKHNIFLFINRKLISFYRIAKKPRLISISRMLLNLFSSFVLSLLVLEQKKFGRRTNGLGLDSPGENLNLS